MEDYIVISVLDYQFAYPVNLTIGIEGTSVSANCKICYQLRETDVEFCYNYACADEVIDAPLSDYNGLYEGDYNLGYSDVYYDEFNVSSNVEFWVKGGTKYYEEYDATFPLYSAANNLSARIIPTQNWVNVLIENNFSVVDFSGKNLAAYKIESGLAFLVAAVVEDWAELCAMTSETIIDKYGDVLALYLSTQTTYVVNPLPAFLVSVRFENSVYAPKACTQYVGMDYESIYIPAESISVSDESVVF